MTIHSRPPSRRHEGGAVHLHHEGRALDSRPRMQPLPLVDGHSGHLSSLLVAVVDPTDKHVPVSEQRAAAIILGQWHRL